MRNRHHRPSLTPRRFSTPPPLLHLLSPIPHQVQSIFPLLSNLAPSHTLLLHRNSRHLSCPLHQSTPIVPAVHRTHNHHPLIHRANSSILPCPLQMVLLLRSLAAHLASIWSC